MDVRTWCPRRVYRQYTAIPHPHSPPQMADPAPLDRLPIRAASQRFHCIPRTTVAASTIDFAPSRSSHPLPALACLLACSCPCSLLGSLGLIPGLSWLIVHWNMQSRCTGLPWAHRRSLGSVLMRTHERRSSAMATEIRRRIVGCDWQAD